MTPNSLRITSSLFVISILYFTFFASKEGWIEYGLAVCLIITIVFSQLFWINPIKDSLIHKWDAIIAKIVIAYFILYTILYQLTDWFSAILYGFVLICMAVFFFLSNYYSSKEWCCEKHLEYHGLLHIFAFFATFFAF